MKKYIPIAEMLWFQEGPGVRNTQYTSSGVKLLNVANLVDGVLDITNTDRYISEDEAYNRYKHFLVDDGDLIIASSGIKVEYFDKKMGFAKKEQLPLCMNTSTIRFKVLNKEQVSIRYFMYYLKSEHFKEQLNHQITGSAQLNFGPSHLKKMLFPIVEMETQQQIVRKLDVLHGIENRLRQELSLLDQLVKSRFIELFGDPVSNSMGLPTEPMTTVCAIIDGDRGKNYPKQDEFSDTGYCLFLNAKNVTATGFSFENRMFITKEKDKALHNGKLERGDVVLTTRGTLGNLAFYDDSVTFKNVRINSGMVILRMKKSVMTEVFFMEQFKLQLQSIKGKIASGSAQPQLPISTMNKIRILLAPMALQEQFAAFVEQTDKSKYYSSLSFRYCQAAENAYRQEWITCRTSDF